MPTPIGDKVGASMVNISLMVFASVPIYLLTWAWWQFATALIVVWFVYNVIFRERCIGMRLVSSFIEPPASLPYIAAYTAGFASILISWRYPFDLLAGYASANVASVAITGNTFHGFITGSSTMTRAEYLTLKKCECLTLLAAGERRQAVASMMTAMRKIDNEAPPYLNQIAIEAASLGFDDCIRSYIEGFE